MDLLESLRERALRCHGEDGSLDGFLAARFGRGVATPNGLAFEPGDYGLVEDADGDGPRRTFSLRTGKFTMVRSGNFEILPNGHPAPADIPPPDEPAPGPGVPGT